MTFSIPHMKLPDFFNLLFSSAGLSRSSEEMSVPDFEADRFEREVLREIIFSNHGAINSDYDIAAVMTQNSRFY
jgi:hypothetical protein